MLPEQKDVCVASPHTRARRTNQAITAPQRRPLVSAPWPRLRSEREGRALPSFRRRADPYRQNGNNQILQQLQTLPPPPAALLLRCCLIREWAEPLRCVVSLITSHKSILTGRVYSVSNTRHLMDTVLFCLKTNGTLFHKKRFILKSTHRQEISQ